MPPRQGGRLWCPELAIWILIRSLLGKLNCLQIKTKAEDSSINFYCCGLGRMNQWLTLSGTQHIHKIIIWESQGTLCWTWTCQSSFERRSVWCETSDGWVLVRDEMRDRVRSEMWVTVLINIKLWPRAQASCLQILSQGVSWGIQGPDCQDEISI